MGNPQPPGTGNPAARAMESKALQPFQTSAEQSGSMTAYAI
jgi:hypothetical protein